MRMPSRVFILGLDGATLDLLLPWAAAGFLPHTARLFQEGAWGPLRSTIQPHTAPAWTSFMTGRNPGAHGVFDFIERVPGSYGVRLMHGALGRTRSLWRLLSEAGYRVGTVNVPMTYPPEAIRGFMISGIDAPGIDANFTAPPSLREELRRHAGPYIIAASAPDLQGWLEGLHAMVESRIRAVRYLLAAKPWDVFMVVFQATDMVQHLFWKHMLDERGALHPDPTRPFGDAVLSIYQKIDGFVGELLATLPEDVTLVALSDHGAGPLRKVVFVNRLLADVGVLRYRRRRGTLARGAAHAGMAAAKRYLPPRLKSWVKRRGAGLRDTMESYLTSSLYDWSATRAYSLGIYGNIFFNQAGREPEGVLRLEERERVTREISDALLGLRDPDTGQPVVERVHRREELYRGPFVERAPDLVIQWRGYEYDCRQRFGHEETSIFGDVITFSDLAYQPMTAVHRLHGFLAARGPGVRRGARPVDASILDVAPTVMAFLGLQPPVEFEGRVLAELLEEEWQGGRAVPAAAAVAASDFGRQGYTGAEAAAVKERLRGLGYL